MAIPIVMSPYFLSALLRLKLELLRVICSKRRFIVTQSHARQVHEEFQKDKLSAFSKCHGDRFTYFHFLRRLITRERIQCLKPLLSPPRQCFLRLMTKIPNAGTNRDRVEWR